MEVKCICKKCGKEFIDKNCPSRRKKTCSFECYRSICESFLIHGKGKKSPSYRSGTTCDSYGYIKILDWSSPMANSQGYVPEHRWIMSKKIGRPLTKDEIVHHIDGNHKNNNPKNLIIMTEFEHKHHHGLGRKMPDRWKNKHALKK